MTTAGPYTTVATLIMRAERDALTPVSWRMPHRLAPEFMMARDDDGQYLMRHPETEGGPMTMFGMPVEIFRDYSPEAVVSLISAQGKPI